MSLDNDVSRFGWPIIRTKPIARRLGRALPMFINNSMYFLTTVDVYEDGAIDAWGFLDRDLFQKKAATGWIATQPEDGSLLSFHNLGSMNVRSGEWHLDTETIPTIVDEELHRLNPGMTGLIDMGGSDVELENGVRYSKLGLADERPYRLNEAGELVLGSDLPIIVRRGQDFEVTRWFIFADGKTQVGFAPELLAIEEVEDRFLDGRYVLEVPDDAWLHIPPLGHLRTHDGFWYVDYRERIKEARNELDILAGGKGCIQRCRDAFDAYEADPSESNRLLLKEAYEATPEHLQMYCGDMDSKDGPIRQVLYSDEPNDDFE